MPRYRSVNSAIKRSFDLLQILFMKNK
jgi:hypothetical protein